MNFIKELCSGKKGEYIHRQFVRYGKGEYERLLFSIKKGKNLSIKSSFDFANEFVRIIAENIDENIQVSGKVVGSKDFESEWNFSSYSKRMGIFSGEVNEEFTPKKLKEFYDKFNTKTMLLNFKGEKYKLKTRNNPPKPGSDVKDDFCSAILPLELLGEFNFDFGKDFLEAKIVHRLKIEDIAIPKEYVNDFAKARLYGIRKGKLIREIYLDGSKVIKEYKLEV
jgi:hypothetical protein